MSADSNVKCVLRYFDGCNAGDPVDLKGTLDPEVMHYFLPVAHKPI